MICRYFTTCAEKLAGTMVDMATTHFKSTPVSTNADLPAVGSTLAGFTLVGQDLQDITLADFAGKSLILNIFPSVDTGVCAASVRRFNEEAAALENTTVLCVSADLPFAFARFCGAEGIDNVVTASDFRGGFGEANGLVMTDGPLAGLLARAVIVVDGNGVVTHTQLVEEITTEPDYEAAKAAIA